MGDKPRHPRGPASKGPVPVYTGALIPGPHGIAMAYNEVPRPKLHVLISGHTSLDLDYNPAEYIESIRSTVARSTRPPTKPHLVVLKYGKRVLLDGTSLGENGVPPGGRILAALVSGGHQSSLANTRGGHASAAGAAARRERDKEKEDSRAAAAAAAAAASSSVSIGGGGLGIENMARLAIESRWGGTARNPLNSVNWDAVRASMGKGGHGASSGRGPSHAHHGSGPPRGGAGRGGAGGGEGNEELFASVSPEAFAAASKRINELKTKFKGIVHGIRAATRLSAEAKSRAAKEAEREAAKAREAFAKAEREAAERRATHRREHDAAVAAALEDSHARERREIDALLAEITTGIADLRTDSGGGAGGAGAGARAGGGSLTVNTSTRHNGSLSNMNNLFGSGSGKRTRRTRRIRK